MPGSELQAGSVKQVPKQAMFILATLLVVLVLVLAIAWFDGGREEQRLIVEPVDVPERNS